MVDSLTNNFSIFAIYFLTISVAIFLIVFFRKQIVLYVKESIAELKKTNWPTTKWVQEMFFVVVAISFIIAFFTGIFDLFFTKIFEELIKY